MNEWLFVAVVLNFAAPQDAQVADYAVLIVRDEAACKKATEIAKEQFPGKWLLVTCDEIKGPPVIIERNRGNKT